MQQLRQMGLALVFAAQALALVVYGVLNAATVAAGAWQGALRWPFARRGMVS